MINDTKPTNCFSPEYVSEIVPFREELFRLPILAVPVRYLRDNIAPNEEAKRARLLRANI